MFAVRNTSAATAKLSVFEDAQKIAHTPERTVEREMRRIAALSAEAVIQEQHSSLQGLSAVEAASRQRIYGPNLIAAEAQRSGWKRFMALLASPLSLLLLVLAGVNLAIGETWGGLMIGIMVMLSSLLSFVQEHRSDRAAQKLRSMVATTATVLRTTKGKIEIPLVGLVPGDIIFLSAGDIIPADVRILSSKSLFISQAALTGESLPVEKTPFAIAQNDAEVFSDIVNLAFMGTNVMSGTGMAIVIATAEHTAFGHIAADLVKRREISSFDQGINKYIRLIILFMLVMVPLVFLVNGLSKGDWLEALLFAVAVAVGLTPEMLPMIITINLAKGALAMSEKKVIVKRLNAIQNFGAMDILCTDKTGTLTQDKIILEQHVDIDGTDSSKVVEYAYLNSYFQTGMKNLLDVAILSYVDVHEKIEPDKHYQKIDEVPFDFERRRMSVIVQQANGSRLLICKGAAEEILSVCTDAEHGGVPAPLASQHGTAMNQTVDSLNQDGFRVIAVAYKQLPPQPADSADAFSKTDESALTLLGYIAFLDPPKDSASEAIIALHHYGVNVKVLSGDNGAVVLNVCRHVGLAGDHVVLGNDIDALDDDALGNIAERSSMFAKLNPMQKARVIRCLQKRNHVVGYLGDGINDGAALKAADVGISVDSAVDIAKESADIILMRKSLIVLKDGVLEGRRVFGNITKYIKMSSSSNFGNMLSVLGASAMLPFLPMAPIQILLNNLLYDVSQTAIATDHVDRDYLKQPRRWEITDIGRFMLTLGPVSSLFDYLTFGILWFVFGAAHQSVLFQTGWFVESLLSQTLVVHIIRTGKIPFAQSKPSLPLLMTTIMIVLLALWLPTSPFSDALGLTALPLLLNIAILLIVSSYLLLTQLLKSWLMSRFGLK
ncbi:Magnesium-transporting ATPase, P-type 1 (Mg(2+) transport ATPase, P-type 1) [Herminiimonas arsenicoxydans]|uniref:Magnesium-transporting ATPase, P-type 1 n=1 Tax=Herminiimonas arsenicoxydans TaxID=204773 RepID=A4G7I5_HERAR|nr:Magnesium-transporting ATPase, P-type 1 (Mg(2+) transport ATPase, P-type 1) [Herminiimonas arsenicoxydans]